MPSTSLPQKRLLRRGCSLAGLGAGRAGRPHALPRHEGDRPTIGSTFSRATAAEVGPFRTRVEPIERFSLLSRSTATRVCEDSHPPKHLQTLPDNDRVFQL